MVTGMSNNILTEKGTAFLVLYPDSLEINNDVLDKLALHDNKSSVYVSKDDWLHYQPDGDDQTYSWKVPGIKLIFGPDVNFDKAKELADEFVVRLKEQSGHDIQLVYVDKTKLTQVG